MAKHILDRTGRGRLVRGNYAKVAKYLQIPKGINDLAMMSAYQETQTGDVAVSYNEFVLRALIDRIGKVKGERVARKLLIQYFGGVAFVPEAEAEAALDARRGGRKKIRDGGVNNGRDKDVHLQD
jgi:hypothetical protein